LQQPLDSPTQTTNSSAQDSPALIQKEILRWNWGAFLLGWIWALGNKLWIWLPIGLAANAISLIPSQNNKTFWISQICQILISVVLGIKGSEWAWKSKKWKSIEHFRKTQKTWLTWGIVFSVALFIIGIVLGVSGNNPSSL
jgi:hypothetical protein